jgi:antitoxin component YwqK of YwqJK toxin-antitoxin module
LKSRGTWANGREEGLTTAYFENGTIQFEANYRQGKIIGVSKVFFDNGKLCERKLYDSLGNLNYISTWEPSGNLKYKFVVPIVAALKDTVMAGEKVIVKIAFPFTLKGEILLNAIEADEKGRTYQNPDTLKISNKKFIYYSTTFDSAGTYKISFKFDHLKIDATDTLNIKGVISDKSIVVMGSKKKLESS